MRAFVEFGFVFLPYQANRLARGNVSEMIYFHHHHHHFICPIIQQYAHLHRYNFRRAGQQGPTKTLTTAALKRVIKQLLGTYSSTRVKYLKSKGSLYSTTEHRVPELVPVLGSQPAGDVNHKPDGRLPLLSARPAVTPPTTLKRAATNFADR